MRALRTKALWVGLLLVAAPLLARAEPDTFFLGRAAPTADKTYNAGDKVNAYAALTSVNPDGRTLAVEFADGDQSKFQSGDLVMVMQTALSGWVPAAGTPINLDGVAAGQWEFAVLDAAPGASTLHLSARLVNTYTSPGAQVIRVPEWDDVTVSDGVTLSPPAWNGKTGGVLTFLAKGTVTLGQNSSIDASGTGFRGGKFVYRLNTNGDGAVNDDNVSGMNLCNQADNASGIWGALKGEGLLPARYGVITNNANSLPVISGGTNPIGMAFAANAGGSGGCRRAGGGGGGNYGVGGAGGKSDDAGTLKGQGGARLQYSLTKQLPLGGGGGSGHVANTSATSVGGAGGGLIYIRAGAMAVSGTGTYALRANGAAGSGGVTEAGGAGGGAGGTIFVRVAGSVPCNISLEANGGAGGDNANSRAAGGGGGGGRVRVQANGYACSSMSAQVGVGGTSGDGTYSGGTGGPGLADRDQNPFAEPPEATVTFPAQGDVLNNTTAMQAITGTVTGATPSTVVTIYLDGVALAQTVSVNTSAGTFSVSPSGGLAEGTNREIRAVTTQDGLTRVGQPKTFTVDRTPPSLDNFTVSAGGSALTNGKKTRFATATFQFTSNDTNATFWCRLGTTGTATQCSSPHVVTLVSEGAAHFEVYSRDAAGNTSTTQSFEWTLDQTAPNPPFIALPAPPPNPLAIVGGTPSISGTVGENNLGVSVYIDDGVTALPATVTATTWTFTPEDPLSPDGVHWVRVVATDEAGNTSSSAVRVFTVDTAAPAKPTILSPANNASISSLRPVVQVSAEAASTLTVTLNPGGLATTVTVSAPGTWEITPSTDLTNGTTYTLSVTAKDSVNNTSSAASVTFIVDTTSPGAPSVTQPSSSPPLATGAVQVQGSAEAGSTVLISLGASQVGTVSLAQGVSAFTFDIPLSLADGTYSLSVRAKDAAGNLGTATTVNFTVDTKSPVPPVITQPSNGSAVSSNTPTIGGTAENNSTVSVTITATGTTTGGPYTGTGNTGPTGNWTVTSLSPSTPLAENGTYQVRATARDAAGNVSQLSTETSFRVDTVAPNAPVVLEPEENAYVSSTTPLFRGTAEAGTTVTATFSGNRTVTALVSSSGDWALTAPVLGQGAQSATFKVTDAAGTPSTSNATRNVTVDTDDPGVPTVSSPSNGQLLSTSTPALIGTAEANATVIVSTGGVPIGTATVSGGGAWSFTAPLSFGEGAHTLTIRARDRAGNESGDLTLNFSVDTRPPPQPVLTAPSGYVRVTTPGISGTAEPGSAVTVSLRLKSAPAVVVKTGQATADASGNWAVTTLTPAGALDQTTYTAEAFARDGAGNQGLTSSLLTFTVDSVAPATPVITFPANGNTIGTDTPTLTGTADAETDVILTLTGPDTSSTTDDREWTLRSNRTGDWKIDVIVAEKLVGGEYVARVKAVDEAGNESPLSAEQRFNVDTDVPDTSFTLTPRPLTNTNTEPFEYASTKALVTFECSLDGDEFETCLSVYPVQDGSHTLLARARDTSTNLVDPSPARYQWTVDTKAPTITFGLTPPAVTNELSAHFTFAADEPNVTFTCFLDGAPVTDCDGDVTVTINQTEPVVLHTFAVQGTDAAGNTKDPVGSPWTVNRSLPDTVIQASPANPSNSSSATFAFVAVPEDPGMTFECNLDSAGFTPCNPSVTFFGLAHGAHTLVVRAKDALNNADPQPASFSWGVDLVAPETTLVVGPQVLSPQTLAHFEFDSEPGATFECRLLEEGGSSTPDFAACASPRDEVHTDGTYTLFVRAKDPAGNVDPTPIMVVWTVDTLKPAPPEVAADVRDRIFRTTTPELRGTAESGSTVLVSIDDGTAVSALVAGGTWSFTPTDALAQGGHLVSVQAVDAAGNASAPSVAVSFGVDTEVPTTQIVSGPDGRIRTSSVEFVFGSNEADATFQCSFDGAEFEPCTTFVRDDLVEGTYTLKVRAVDRAGNEGPVVSRSWKVYLGGDTRTKGGGLSCASTGAGGPSLTLLALGTLALLAGRRRRS